MSNTPSLSDTTLPNKIFEDVVSFLRSHILMLAVTEFDLFTRLAHHPGSIEEIAATVGLAHRPTEQMVTALAAMGYLKKTDGRFSPTPLALKYLVRGQPPYLGTYFNHMLSAPNSYEALRQALLTDTPQNFNQRAKFAEMIQHQEQARDFAELMHALSYDPAIALCDAFDFSNYTCLLDMAGGMGTYAVRVAEQHPQLNVILAELPWMRQVAEEFISHKHLTERIKPAVCDMFSDPFPAGADILLLSHILHDWPKGKGCFLLKKAFDYLPAGGVIIVHEVLFNHHKTGPLFAALYSLSMQLVTEGMQYTAGELQQLLSEAGFKNIRHQETMENYWITVAEK